MWLKLFLSRIAAFIVLYMNIYPGLVELVEETILTAIDEGADGLTGIRFDPELLGRVRRATARDADRFNAAVATCEVQMKEWIHKAAESQNLGWFGHARAALALQEKLQEPPHRGYRPDGNGGFTPVI
jgi:hypothetical protein